MLHLSSGEIIQHVHDLRSEHQDKMLHMFSVLVGCRTRTPSPTLSFTGQLDQFTNISPDYFLPSSSDYDAVKKNLDVLVGRILTEYFPSLAPFSKVVPKHILHKYSAEMCKKSEVVVFDVLMKNEAEMMDMLA